ncbi:SDR family oxidoreductase [Photobacterium lipolyticum]|nr:SDR family oxidoreductase [Photobacterium lipolyticum]
MNIAHSVILITAAGSPMGKALSLHFASLGAKLALVDIDAERLELSHQACLAIGGTSYPLLLTSRNEQAIASLMNDIDKHYGSINVLINYWLGADLPTLFSPSSVDMFCHSMTEVATTFFTFGKQAANYMREHHCQGVIINLATNQPDSQHPIAGCSKAVISGLTQSWARELAEFNIRVGGVVPLVFNDEASHSQSTVFSQSLQYEIVRSAEYIVENDYFNGRMIEAEVV